MSISFNCTNGDKAKRVQSAAMALQALDSDLFFSTRAYGEWVTGFGQELTLSHADSMYVSRILDHDSVEVVFHGGSLMKLTRIADKLDKSIIEVQIKKDIRY